MKGYNLGHFVNGKAFIHFDGRGKCNNFTYGPRICINNKGDKLFELPDRDMIVNEFEPEDVAFVMHKSGLYALMNNKGEFLTEFIYDLIYGGSEEGLFEARRNGKHGHIDITGKEIIPCMYDKGNYFLEGVAAECLNGKWGMVDYFNNTTIPFEYENIIGCKNNLISVKRNNKWGLINKNNEIVVDFLYDDIYSWCSRECPIYQAKKGDKWGLIDRYNNIIEDFIYDDSQSISDNEDNTGEFIILSKDNKKAIYSTKKQGFITDFIYDFVGYLSQNRFLISIDSKYGFIDTEGNEITPLVYDECYEDYNADVCVVSKDNKYGLIDLLGNLILSCEYKKLHNCHEGLILATDSDGNNGYINIKGETIIPFGEYYLCSDYSCGFAVVHSNKYGAVYINKTGKISEIKI